MMSLGQDLRYAIRMLAKNPGFTAVAVVTLALGIGANSAIFSVVDAVLLRPLPYPESNRLVEVNNRWKFFGGYGWISYPEFQEVRKQAPALETSALYRGRGFTWTEGGTTERVRAMEATADLFLVLGVAPALGNAFPEEEQVKANEKIIVLSYGLWQRRFAGASDVIGKTMRLNREPYTVIGVMPAAFQFPDKETEAWLPVAQTSVNHEGRRAHFRQLVARLRDGATIEQARQQLLAVSDYFKSTYPNEFTADSGFTMAPSDLRERMVGDARTPLLVLLGAVVLVLLIACANVANLFLARAAAREREMAVRAALGAGRGALVRQLLVESVLMALMGATAGLLLAWWGVDVLANLPGANVPRLDEVRVDGRVLAFTLGLSLLTGLLFGLAPAWKATRGDLLPALQEGSRGTRGTRHRRFHNGLVIAEVALSVVLLAGTALLLRSFWRITQVEPGFQQQGLLTASALINSAQYPQGEQRTAFYVRLLESLRSEPGIAAAAAAGTLPLQGSGDQLFQIEGRSLPAGQMMPSEQNRVVTHGYFSAMGMTLLRGRDFRASDTATSPPVVILNDALARKHWKDGDALGARIAFGNPENGAPWVTVVGIVSDVRDEALHLRARPTVYLPHSRNSLAGMTLVVRSATAAVPSEELLRRKLGELDREAALFSVRSMEQIVNRSVASQQLNLVLISIFAVQALALAGVGLYGVMSYLVQQQTRETGIRMAFGASPRDVLRLFFERGFALLGAGLGIGLVAAFAVAQFLKTLLFEVQPSDPASYVTITLVLAGVAALACWIPARRAASVDPMVALRHE